MELKNLKIYYFGNPYIEEDSLALKVADELRREFPKVSFLHIKDTFQLMDIDFSGALLLDVADGLGKVKLIDAEKIKTRNASTTHDFDLGFYLKVSGNKADIIAVPKDHDLKMAVDEVREIIRLKVQ